MPRCAAGRGPVERTQRHAHGPSASRRPFLTALGVGLVHGGAGSATVTLVVLGAVPDPAWGATYLMVFGLGTVAGMAGVTALVCVPFVLTAARLAGVHRALAVGSGLLSLAFGTVLAYRIGVVGGPFGAGVSWTPY